MAGGIELYAVLLELAVERGTSGLPLAEPGPLRLGQLAALVVSRLAEGVSHFR
jgi:hypothetical protein